MNPNEDTWSWEDWLKSQDEVSGVHPMPQNDEAKGEPPPQSGAAKAETADTRPVIKISSEVFEMVDAAVGALRSDPELYSREGKLVRLVRVGELDADQFWQIHRSTLVNTRFIAGVSRDLRGRQLVAVKGHPEKLEVSRSFTGLFKGM
jgi:hypothetical protein